MLWCASEALRDAGWWDRRGSARLGLIVGLGAEWMLALHQVRCGLPDDFPAQIDLPAYRQARAELTQQEQHATKRRSGVRHLAGHLTGLLARWMASD